MISPKYSVSEELEEIDLLPEPERLYGLRLTAGGTIKYQTAKERTIRIIPIRKIAAGFRRVFLVFCKIAQPFLDFKVVCYHAELLILYAL